METGSIDHIEQTLFWYGWYEKAQILTFLTLLKTNTNFIDIGANVGYYSLAAAAKFKGISVMSFEPSSNTFLKFQRNIELNRLKNITPFQQAISDKPKEQVLYVSGQDNTGMSGFQKAENFTGKTELVSCTTIDLYISKTNLHKLDIVKIDIEGAEMNVLKGMTDTIINHQPVLLIEICAETLQKFNYTPADIHQFLARFHYRGYKTEKANILEKLQEWEDTDLAFFFPEKYTFPKGIKING